MTAGRLSPQFLAELRARTRLVEVVRARIVLQRSGREWAGCCPFHNEKSASFTVNEGKAFTHCFGCGHHSDVIGFVMRYDGLDFMDAVRRLAADAGMAVPGDDRPPPDKPLAPFVKRPAPEDLETQKEYQVANAVRLWKEGRPWRGTAVEAYLTGRRCCPIDDLPTLRFHADLRYRDVWPKGHDLAGQKCEGNWPAMIAPFQDLEGNITGLHRTFLTPAGDKAPVPKVKKMTGVVWGSAIRFARADRHMRVAEGIESGLSVRRPCPDRPLWIAGSLGNIAGAGEREDNPVPHPTIEGRFIPSVHPDMSRPGIRMPAGVEAITILADADGDRPTGEALVERAARRFHADSIKVFVAWPPAGQDFNDMAQEDAV